MAKVFDVDKYLDDHAVEIVLGKKKFLVKDIPYEFNKLIDNSDPESQKKAIKSLLKCTDEDIAPYGVAGIAAIIKEITENLFQPLSPSNQ